VGEIFSPPIDDVFDAPGQCKIAIIVQYANVSGAQPAVYKGRGSGGRVVAVAAHHGGPANHDFSGALRAELHPGVVDDSDLNPSGEADGPRFALTWRERIRSNLMRRLSHAVGANNRCPKALLDLLLNGRRELGRAGPDEACAMVWSAVAIRAE